MDWQADGGIRHKFTLWVDSKDWAVIEDRLPELVRDDFWDVEGILVPFRAVEVTDWEVVENTGDDWQTTVEGTAIIAGRRKVS